MKTLTKNIPVTIRHGAMAFYSLPSPALNGTTVLVADSQPFKDAAARLQRRRTLMEKAKLPAGFRPGVRSDFSPRNLSSGEEQDLWVLLTNPPPPMVRARQSHGATCWVCPENSTLTTAAA